MNRNIGRLYQTREKILSARLARREFIARLKREVASLRRGFIAENLAIHAIWFGPGEAEQAALRASAEADRTKKAEAEAEAARHKKAEATLAKKAEEAALAKKAAQETARAKKAEVAREEERAKAEAARVKKAMEAAEAEKQAAAQVTPSHESQGH